MKKRNGILISFAVISLTLAAAAVAGCAEPTMYDITVNGGTASVTEAEEGATITLTPGTPATGQEFVNWEVNGEAITGNTFEMPAEDVTVEAVYRAIDYTLTVTGGSATVDGDVVTTANYQDTVTLSVDLEAVPAPARKGGKRHRSARKPRHLHRACRNGPP